MQPNEKRVVKEEQELRIKIQALGAYLSLNPQVGEEQIELLEKQSEYMMGYLGILQKRIKTFK